MANDGKSLSDQQVKEYVAARNAGLPAPKGLENVVFDSGDLHGHGYRFLTAEEAKNAPDAVAEQKAADEHEALVEKLRKQAGDVPIRSEDPAPTPTPRGA